MFPLHFTTSYVGVIVSQELTVRKVSFTGEHEATRQIEELKAELAKARTEIDELTKSTSSMEKFLSQADQKVKMKDFDALKLAIKKFPEFDDLVLDLANEGFNITIAEVKNLAPDLDLAPAYQAYEPAMEEDEDEARSKSSMVSLLISRRPMATLDSLTFFSPFFFMA